MNISNTVVFQTISTFSAWEVQNFRKWLQSPAHNSRNTLSGVFEHLWLCCAKGQTPDAQYLFETVFPGQDYEEKKLGHALSWLMTQVKSFLMYQEVQADTPAANRYLVQHFRKRGFEPGFRQSIRDARQNMEKSGEYSTETQINQFRLDFEEYQWQITQKRAQEMPFDLLAGSLTAYFTTKILQLGCMYRAHEAMGKQSPDTLPRLDAILRAFPADTLQATPETALYCAGYYMLSKTDEAYWPGQFRALLEQHIHLFPHDEARDLLMMAINYGIGRGNRGDRDYFDEVLSIYDLGFKLRLLLDKSGYLSKFTYNNVLLLMIARNHWERAEQFLETYREQVAPEEREAVYRYNRAVFLFRKGSFGEAQQILSQLSFSDPMYNLEARRMLLRIYYEEQSFDALESLLDNLLTWVRRHSEIGYHREMYSNLAKFTGKLLKTPSSEKEKRRKLAQKIKDTPLVADREWLLGKLVVSDER